MRLRLPPPRLPRRYLPPLSLRRSRLPRPRLARLTSPHPLANFIAWLLVVFLVLFPKGGVKVGPIPVTWGYLILGLVTPMLLVAWVVRGSARVRPNTLLAFAATIPFQIVFLYTWQTIGIGEMQFFISTFVDFFFFPFVFLLVFPTFSARVDTARFTRWLCNAVFWAAAWGILLFCLWPFTHHLLEIPALTVNVADVGKVAETKHNARGIFLKLISTYNNGNVYGVATFILLPLYTLLEPRRWRRWTVRAALFLTLARTVWAGLLAEQLLSLLTPLLANLQTFPTLRLRGAARQLLVIGGVMAAILVVLFSSSYGLSFLFDPTLGGRSGEITGATHSTFLPPSGIVGFSEVLFASALDIYGYIGLAGILLIFFFPVLYTLAHPDLLQDPVRRAALKGLVLYDIVSLSDGAANLIPVLAFFWFVESVLLTGLPGRPGLYLRPLLDPTPLTPVSPPPVQPVSALLPDPPPSLT